MSLKTLKKGEVGVERHGTKKYIYYGSSTTTVPVSRY
jgi:hypothetical protein